MLRPKNKKCKMVYGGDPGDKKSGAKLPTPSIEQVTADARNFAMRRNMLSAEYTNTGGVIPEVTFNGNPIPYGSPLPIPKKTYGSIPRDATEFNYNEGNTYYIHPQTGDMIEMDPAMINLPQFRKKAAAPKKKGGYMELGGNNPYAMMRNNLETIPALIGQAMDTKRQNQYMMQQYSQLGQMNPSPVEDFQPNPFSLYAKYGGLLRKGGWIQEATKGMRADHPCTGAKFGGESCPPGSPRYNLAKTFRKMASKH